jgi:hypothetical protein
MISVPKKLEVPNKNHSTPTLKKEGDKFGHMGYSFSQAFSE